MDIKNLEVYQIAVEISDLAWGIYSAIPQEFKFKTGQQFLSASDSVGANISEGFGRYHFKDSLNFYYYARGSLYETVFWTNRLNIRNLITKEHYNALTILLENEKVKLNKFIASIRSRK